MTVPDDSKSAPRPGMRLGRPVLESLNCDGRMGVALLGGLALLWALLAGGPGWTAALRYERAALAMGQWWRLVTAHWVHFDARHLLQDSAGLVLLWSLYARELRPWHWFIVLGAATAAIDAGLWWGVPQLQWYLGISGLLHGAWAAGAAAQAVRGDRRGWSMLALLVLKLALERHLGAGLISTGMPVAIAAHDYGALGGLLATAALAARRKPL